MKEYLEDNPKVAYLLSDKKGNTQIYIGEIVKLFLFPSARGVNSDEILMQFLEALSSFGKEMGEYKLVNIHSAKEYDGKVYLSKQPLLRIEKHISERGKYIFAENQNGETPEYIEASIEYRNIEEDRIGLILAEMMFSGSYAVTIESGTYYIDTEKLDREKINPLNEEQNAEYLKENIRVGKIIWNGNKQLEQDIFY